ncbi:MAG: hypothetical protein ABH873_09030 [Candidatus Firestonebacteria bacterium]
MEKKIIEVTWNEGIGSVYERIMLHRFFKSINDEYKFEEVMEFGCPITKGYDNVAFMPLSKVTLTDDNLEKIKEKWKFNDNPEFVGKENLKQYDLVWNFASLQLDPSGLKDMLKYSKKYLLAFVPNVLNCGSPFHFGYHLITRQECRHAERGSLSLRTKRGIMKLFRKNNIKILKCGYIDMPPIPDIGFSRRELKQWLGIKVEQGVNQEKVDYGIVEKLGSLEKKNFPEFIKAVISHHIYILGEK